jgi:hypothetical protein
LKSVGVIERRTRRMEEEKKNVSEKNLRNILLVFEDEGSRGRYWGSA